MKIKTKSTLESFNYLKDKLDKHKKLYYTRFGDGEISLMMGNDTRNHHYSKIYQKELIESFTILNQQYLIGLAVNYPKEKWMSYGVFAPFKSNSQSEEFLIKNNYNKNSDKYESFILFHYLSITKPKLLFNFFNEYIRPKKKMFIGSAKKDVAEKLYGKIDFYINTPPRFSYDTIDVWWPGVIASIDKVELVIPSAGAASNVIAKRLWMANKEIQLLDIGSLIDAIDKKISRTWIRLKGHKVQKILPKEYRDTNFKNKIINLLKDIKYFFRVLIK